MDQAFASRAPRLGVDVGISRTHVMEARQGRCCPLIVLIQGRTLIQNSHIWTFWIWLREALQVTAVNSRLAFIVQEAGWGPLHHTVHTLPPSNYLSMTLIPCTTVQISDEFYKQLTIQQCAWLYSVLKIVAIHKEQRQLQQAKMLRPRPGDSERLHYGSGRGV